ncbi:hypothetical protein Drorol1_Dr00004739 [Drosera rotundifolia]
MKRRKRYKIRKKDKYATYSITLAIVGVNLITGSNVALKGNLVCSGCVEAKAQVVFSHTLASTYRISSVVLHQLIQEYNSVATFFFHIILDIVKPIEAAGYVTLYQAAPYASHGWCRDQHECKYSTEELRGTNTSHSKNRWRLLRNMTGSTKIIMRKF